MVLTSRRGLDARTFPLGRPSDLLSSMSSDIPRRKDNSEPEMETNEPTI